MPNGGVAPESPAMLPFGICSPGVTGRGSGTAQISPSPTIQPELSNSMAMAAEMRQLPVGPKDYRRGEYEETLPLVAPESSSCRCACFVRVGSLKKHFNGASGGRQNGYLPI